MIDTGFQIRRYFPFRMCQLKQGTLHQSRALYNTFRKRVSKYNDMVFYRLTKIKCKFSRNITLLIITLQSVFDRQYNINMQVLLK